MRLSLTSQSLFRSETLLKRLKKSKNKELGTRNENEYGIAHFELVPLNPMFPTLSSLNQEIRIIGVARERVETL